MTQRRRVVAMGSVNGGLLLFALWICIGTGSALAGVEEGKKAFEEKKCLTCHSLGAEKGKMAQLGGPLDGVGNKRDAAWLTRYLPDPQSQIPDAKMPKQPLTDTELEDLVAYLLSLK